MRDRETAIRNNVEYNESRGIAYDCLGTASARYLLDELDALRARLAAAEGLLGKARRLLHEPSMFSREKLDACVERIDAHLAAAPAPGPEGGGVAR